MTDLSDFVSAVDDPTAATSALEAAMSPEIPLLDTPPPADVTLFAGWQDPEGQVWRDAVVRELNGKDEERLVQATTRQDLTVAQFIEVLLRQAVVQVGPNNPVSGAVLEDLVIGDRNELALAIRKLTWGSDLVIENFRCTLCQHVEGVIIELDKDIPYRRVPTSRTRFVELRGGHKAEVTLVTGRVNRLAIQDGTRTNAEETTTIINECLKEIDGQPVKNLAHVMGMSDRRTIMKALTEAQPGPVFEEGVSVPCSSCGGTATYPLSMVDLFRS